MTPHLSDSIKVNDANKHTLIHTKDLGRTINYDYCYAPRKPDQIQSNLQTT